METVAVDTLGSLRGRFVTGGESFDSVTDYGRILQREEVEPPRPLKSSSGETRATIEAPSLNERNCDTQARGYGGVRRRVNRGFHLRMNKHTGYR